MYCTAADLERAISRETLLALCDDEGVGDYVESPPNIAYENIVSAIKQADATIDSYIGCRYTLPLAEPVPVQVRDASKHLSVCNLFDRRREMDTPEGVERRRKEWMRWLENVQAGRATLPGLVEPSGGGYAASKTEENRVFPDSLLSQY